MRTAVYPGTFDPITNGHVDIIERTARLFDRVVVAVAVNSTKQPLFSAEERLALVRESLLGFENVEVREARGLIVEFAREVDAQAIVRGLRAVSDFEYELQMALTNRSLHEEVSTLFMAPHEKYTFISSSIIRELARYNADIDEFVPPCVAHALRERYRAG